MKRDLNKMVLARRFVEASIVVCLCVAGSADFDSSPFAVALILVGVLTLIEILLWQIQRHDEQQEEAGVSRHQAEEHEAIKHIASNTPLRTGFLIPGNTPTPSDAPMQPDWLFIVLMGDCLSFARNLPHHVITQAREPMLTIGEKNGAFWMSAKFFSEDGRIVAEIVRNRFHINLNNCFRIEQTDHRLVVFNEHANVVMDLEFLNASCARLAGAYYLRHGASINLNEGVEFKKGRTMSGNISVRGSSFGGIHV